MGSSGSLARTKHKSLTHFRSLPTLPSHAQCPISQFPIPQMNIYPNDYSLLTDLYQLTMAACYAGEGLEGRKASFELFVRRLPAGFGYLVAMGLAQALEYLQELRFSSEQIAALKATEIFTNAPEEFWSLLEERFSGSVWAVKEGTVVFPNEPLLRVEAPLWQAQLVETYLLCTINYQTLIATRGARLREAAGPEAIVLEFGSRRAFGPQASLWAARAALAGGLNATSNVLAALKLGRKPAGTMAHALVMALAATQGSEMQAFSAFHRYFPGSPLLIDTYDTLAAARQLAERVELGDIELAGVRLDSGDLAALSREVRSLLPEVPIFASGDLDEWEIAKLKSAAACIDGYGVGTRLVTGAPVNGVYKLVEIDGIPVMKESKGKPSYPGRKQIFRHWQSGAIAADRLGLAGVDPQADEEPLLQLVFEAGKPVHPQPTLEEISSRVRENVAALPRETRQLENPIPLTVEISSELQALAEKTKKIN